MTRVTSKLVRAFVSLAAATFFVAHSNKGQAAVILTEISERRDADFEVQRLWHSDDFNRLEALAGHWRTNRVRTQAGFWKLSIFYEVIDEAQKSAIVSDYPDGIAWQRLKRWMQAYPTSPIPQIAFASLLLIQANKGRPWSADNVPVSPWKPRVDLVREARSVLEASKKIAADEPHWHTIYLRLLRVEGKSDEDLLLAHADALAAFPLYDQTHFELLDYLIDRWEPRFELVDAFINTVLARTQELTGMTAYARLYERALPKLQRGQFYALEGRSWPKMQAGLDEIDKSYPSHWNYHQHALHACIAGDKPVARTMMASAAEEQAQYVWRDAIAFKQCKSWVEH